MVPTPCCQQDAWSCCYPTKPGLLLLLVRFVAHGTDGSALIWPCLWAAGTSDRLVSQGLPGLRGSEMVTSIAVLMLSLTTTVSTDSLFQRIARETPNFKMSPSRFLDILHQLSVEQSRTAVLGSLVPQAESSCGFTRTKDCKTYQYVAPVVFLVLRSLAVLICLACAAWSISSMI